MGLYPSSFWIWKQEDGELLNTSQTDIHVADKLNHDRELTTTDQLQQTLPCPRTSQHSFAQSTPHRFIRT
jgi:hypothetical protein